MIRAARNFISALLALLPLAVPAEMFQLPTANHTLFERGGEEKYFVGTTGKPWTSGTFGCVRSGGFQMHEGIDIRCLERDRKGNPADPVLATADGVVAYINSKPQLSNYGNYIILRHRVEGMEIYSLYAHLSAVRTGLKIGASVAAGEVIATMGRTTNTRERISPERAHLHFELNLVINDRFATWYEKFLPGQRNDHGEWNGQNLLGLDPRAIFHRQKKDGKKFSLVQFIQGQPELCRVFVRKTDFPWLRRYAALVRQSPAAEKEGIAGYELALNFNGVPVQATARAASEIKGKAKFQLVSVNEAEQKKNPARKLVTKKGGSWELASAGLQLLELLTY